MANNNLDSEKWPGSLERLAAIQGYPLWYPFVRMHLRAKGLWDEQAQLPSTNQPDPVAAPAQPPAQPAAPAPPVPEGADYRTAAIILAACTQSFAMDYVSMRSGREIWRALSSAYAATAQAHLTTLQLSYDHLRFRSGEHSQENVTQFVGRVKQLVKALNVAGAPVTEIQAVHRLLRAMPESYAGRVQPLLTWSSMSNASPLTFATVLPQLLAEEAHMQANKASSAFMATPANSRSYSNRSSTPSGRPQGQQRNANQRPANQRGRQQGGRGSGSRPPQRSGGRPQQQRQQGNRPQGKCWNCGQPGHTRANCPNQQRTAVATVLFAGLSGTMPGMLNPRPTTGALSLPRSHSPSSSLSFTPRGKGLMARHFFGAAGLGPSLSRSSSGSSLNTGDNDNSDGYALSSGNAKLVPVSECSLPRPGHCTDIQSKLYSECPCSDCCAMLQHFHITAPNTEMASGVSAGDTERAIRGEHGLPLGKGLGRLDPVISDFAQTKIRLADTQKILEMETLHRQGLENDVHAAWGEVFRLSDDKRNLERQLATSTRLFNRLVNTYNASRATGATGATANHHLPVPTPANGGASAPAGFIHAGTRLQLNRWHKPSMQHLDSRAVVCRDHLARDAHTWYYSRANPDAPHDCCTDSSSDSGGTFSDSDSYDSDDEGSCLSAATSASSSLAIPTGAGSKGSGVTHVTATGVTITTCLAAAPLSPLPAQPATLLALAVTTPLDSSAADTPVTNKAAASHTVAEGAPRKRHLSDYKGSAGNQDTASKRPVRLGSVDLIDVPTLQDNTEIYGKAAQPLSPRSSSSDNDMATTVVCAAATVPLELAGTYATGAAHILSVTPLWPEDKLCVRITLYWDTGAAIHLVNDRSLLHQPVTVNLPVQYGNGTHGIASHMGDVHLVDKDSNTLLILQNAYYVPGMPYCLLSVTSAVANGCSFSFDFKQGICKDAAGRVAAVAQRNPVTRLYEFTSLATVPGGFLASAPASPAPATASGDQQLGGSMAAFKAQPPSDLVALWHHRLGHAGAERLATMAAKDLAAGFPLKASQVRAAPSEVCDGCMLGKYRSKPFKSTGNKADRPLALVHYDLTGPWTPAIKSGARYGLHLVCDNTDFNVFRALKTKGQVTQEIQLALIKLANQCGYQVKAIMGDDAREHHTKELANWCEERGIATRFSAPYAQSQNGKAERLIGILKGTTRAMLHAAHQPPELWAEAMRTASFLRNVLPAPGGRPSPWQQFLGTKPDISWLRVWGAPCYVKRHHVKKTTVEPMAEPGIFVGYVPDCQQYNVLVDGVIRQAAPQHVTVDEAAIVNRVPRKGGSANVAGDTAAGLEATAQPPKAPAEINTGAASPLLSPLPVPMTGTAPAVASPVPPDVAPPVQPALAPGFNPAVPLRQQMQQLFTNKIVPTPTPAPVTDKATNVAALQQRLRDTVQRFNILADLPDYEPHSSATGSTPSHSLSSGQPSEQLGPATQQHSDAAAGPHRQRSVSDSGSGDRGSQSLSGSGVRGSSNSRSHRHSDSGSGSSLLPARSLPPRSTKQAARDNLKALIDADALSATVDLPDPLTLAEALARPDADKWREAMQEELNSLHAHGTWDLVDATTMPAGQRVVGCKWVYTLKRDARGVVQRYKARLVAKGFMQHGDMDVFSPTTRHVTIRAALAHAAAHNLTVKAFDVRTAFLNGDLPEDQTVWLAQPPGYESGGPNMVCRLKKSLYGLRQAPRAWHAKLKSELQAMGFTPTKADASLFTRLEPDGTTTLIVVWVDDGLVISHGDIPDTVIKQLSTRFTIKDIGDPRMFVGIEIIRDRSAGTITISQQRMVTDLVTRHGLADCKPKATPLSVSTRLSKAEGTPLDDRTASEYRELVGSLLYLTTCTRPDIAQAVGTLTRYTSSPTTAHWVTAKGVLRYLAHTRDLGIIYGKDNTTLLGYADADYGGDPDSRRSTTGYAFLMYGGVVSWQSRLQHTVAVSTAEAEYMSASAAVKEALWLSILLSDMGISAPAPVQIYGDNQAAIKLLNNPIVSARSKHIAIAHRFANERVQSNEIAFQYISTKDMIADCLTKALPEPAFKACIKGMGMLN